MLQQFFSDLVLPGCMIQFGTHNATLKSAEKPTLDEIKSFIGNYGGGINNLFFLAGVRADKALAFARAKDTDILKKNYFYIDFDIRSKHPEYTDAMIRGEIFQHVKDTLQIVGKPFSEWRYIVFTGNGLHVYYFGETIENINLENWKYGVGDFFDHVDKAFGEEVDHACVNVARIARMPGAYNRKTVPPKLAEILEFKDNRISLAEIIRRGAELAAEEKNKLQKKLEQMRAQFPDSGDTYSEIQKIPVSKVVMLLMPWTLAADGRHFVEEGDRKAKACFVSDRGNFLVHGGTRYLPPNADGYSPFEVVKNWLNLDNARTFDWFKARFPALQKTGRMMNVGIFSEPLPERPNPRELYKTMRKESSKVLRMSAELDEYKFVNRGKVTRIGALWGTGKSKLAYYFVHMLLQSGYRGIVYSTEVTSAEVMNNLYCIILGCQPSDIEDGRVAVPEELFASYSNLDVYDVTHTKNFLSRMEQILKREYDKAEAGMSPKVDFIVIDYAGMVASKSAGFMKDVFTWATRYGSELQEIANMYGVAILDIFQLGKEGMTDLNGEEHGYIPFVGGPALNASADVAVIIKRNKASNDNHQCTIEIRKSKPLHGMRVNLTMDYDWRNSTFRIAKGGHDISRVASDIQGGLLT